MLCRPLFNLLAFSPPNNADAANAMHMHIPGSRVGRMILTLDREPTTTWSYFYIQPFQGNILLLFYY